MEFDTLALADLAALSGVDVKEIRTYQEVGLLPSVRERPGEVYYWRDVEVLCLIRRALVLGLSISAIINLLSVKREDGTCGDVYTIVQSSLDAIRSTGFEPSPDLPRLVEACPRVGGIRNCPVLAELVQPLTASPLNPNARTDRYRGQAKAARSTAYTIATECVRSDWLEIAASWDRLADLEEMSFRHKESGEGRPD